MYAVQPSEVKLKRLGFFGLENGNSSKGSRTSIYAVVNVGKKVIREQFSSL